MEERLERYGHFRPPGRAKSRSASSEMAIFALEGGQNRGAPGAKWPFPRRWAAKINAIPPHSLYSLYTPSRQGPEVNFPSSLRWSRAINENVPYQNT